MSGWHPNLPDGGLSPNPNDPGNPAMAFPPTVPPVGTSALYYGNGCDVRLRPHVINALISENLAVLDRVGLAYDPGKLTNLRTAIEYIVQRGLPKFSILSGGAFYFNGALDPPCHAYNNGQVVCVIPNVTNQGFVRVDLGPGWWAPVLRNDYQELVAGDWAANVPQIMAYFNGAFYMLGLCASQVPIVLKGTIGFWIRTDGNDVTGDGTANSPDKAFRTINGAWAAVGARYSASPTSHIAFMLGIPGTYERGMLGPYGAGVSITGDPNNRGAYRIATPTNDPYTAIALQLTGINSFWSSGVTFVITNPNPKAYGTQAIRAQGSTGLNIDRCNFDVQADNAETDIIIVESGSLMGSVYTSTGLNDIRFFGNGRVVGSAIHCWLNSTVTGPACGMPNPGLWAFNDLNIVIAGYYIHHNSNMGMGRDLVSVSNCIGRQFIVTAMSTLTSYGQPIPGNAAGQIGDYSLGSFVNPCP